MAPSSHGTMRRQKTSAPRINFDRQRGNWTLKWNYTQSTTKTTEVKQLKLFDTQEGRGNQRVVVDELGAGVQGYSGRPFPSFRSTAQLDIRVNSRFGSCQVTRSLHRLSASQERAFKKLRREGADVTCGLDRVDAPERSREGVPHACVDEALKHLHRNMVASMCTEKTLTLERVRRFARRTQDYCRAYLELQKCDDIESKDMIEKMKKWKAHRTVLDMSLASSTSNTSRRITSTSSRTT